MALAYNNNALPNESALLLSLFPPLCGEGLCPIERLVDGRRTNQKERGYCSSSTAACAAAKRAIGTRNGLQEA